MVPNSATFQRLDNARVVDFLTVSAGVLAQTSTFNSKDADSLRLSLTSMQSASGDPSPQPVLTELLGQNSEFVALLTTRYGVLGLSRNILRHSLREVFGQTLEYLDNWGEDLLKKSQLFFNRPFYVFVDGICERRTIFASVLVEFSDLIAQATKEVTATLQDVNLFVPNNFVVNNTDDQKIDLQMADALGFDHLAPNTLPLLGESMVLRRFTFCLRNLVQSVAQYAEQIRHNLRNQSDSRLQASISLLKAQLQLIESLELPHTLDLKTLEWHRHNLLVNLMAANDSLAEVSELQVSLLSKTEDLNPNISELISADTLRQLTSQLINEGIQVMQAQKAVSAMLHYCTNHQVKASQLISSELAKIDPNLTVASLELYKKIESERSVAGGSSEIKKRSLLRHDELLKIFTARKNRNTAIALLLGALLTACGVKTPPKSEISEDRPAVAYRDEAPATPEQDVNVKATDKNKTAKPVAPAGK